MPLPGNVTVMVSMPTLLPPWYRYQLNSSMRLPHTHAVLIPVVGDDDDFHHDDRQFRHGMLLRHCFFKKDMTNDDGAKTQ